MPNTKALAKDERKKAKRTARKKATPKPKRTTPRGSTEAQSEEVGTRSEQALGK